MQPAPCLATFLAASLICWVGYMAGTQRHLWKAVISDAFEERQQPPGPPGPQPRDVAMAVSTPPSPPSPSSFLSVLDIFNPVKAKGDTFAVVSRMWRGDLPFLESWLRYYLVQLRVDRVYGILTEKSDLAPLRALGLRAGFGDQLQLWVKDLSKQSIDTSVFDPSQIHETFILSVDTDEFVALPVGQSLQSTTAAEPSVDVFELKWRCVPNDTLTEELIPRVGLRCPGVKVMFRSRRFKSFNGPHGINCRRPKRRISMTRPRRTPRRLPECRKSRKLLVLIHLWYRGVYDALFRQSAGHTKSSFSDRNTGVLEFAELVLLSYFPVSKSNIWESTDAILSEW